MKNMETINKNKISSKSLFKVITSEKNNNGSNFTIKSLKTGTEYTYKISRKEYKDKWYTHIFVETGYMNFTRLGTFFKQIYNKGKKVNTPSAIAISYILSKILKEDFKFLDENVEILHTGNCLKCGRPLTDSDSIKYGLGTICRSK